MRPTPLLALLCTVQLLHADPLLTGGGFEQPAVAARTPVEAGGTPLKSPANLDWIQFSTRASHPGPGFSAGMVRGFARTGNQSVYVEFERYDGKTAGLTMVSRLIPVRGGARYRASIWGRNNPDKPLTLAQRAPLLKFEAEFFAADGVANTGEPEIRLQPIPDQRVRLGKRPPLFNSSQWTEFGTDLEAPSDAAFIRLTWRIELGRDSGTTTGIFHLDDASLAGPLPQSGPQGPGAGTTQP